MNVPTTSTRPYLIRALYEWCSDNGFTPYVAVSVDETVQVPREYVKDNEIVLNIGLDATSSLTLGNEYIEFKARFGGKAREILVPISHVVAIYARENGQGMAFPLEPGSTGVPVGGAASPSVPTEAAAPGASETPENKIMQLVDSVAPAAIPSPIAPGDDSPEPPKTPPRPRPSLTRVK
ncbi:MAG: ClpXP protease specificity-enhancing factor [Polaromonas sp.]|nr:ClpXP protease specificity-enhancing factor [Polaromonas sp.]